MQERLKNYVLLDRDGTVIEEKNYLSDPEGVALLPGAAEGLRKLQAAGWGLILVTNQAGIGRGMFSSDDLGKVHARLIEILTAEGVELDGIYFCPHAPAEDCECRKPLPKMAQDAAQDFGFDLKDAWVVGDKAADVALGLNSGARPILVRTGYGRETEALGGVSAPVVDDLLAAAELILSQ